MRKLLSTTAMAIVLSSVAAGFAAAQEDELRAIIRQQQQELEQLKERFERMEDGRWSAREQVERIERMREEDLADTVTRGDHPGSFRLPGTNTSVAIGGYVKADFIYDVNADLGDSFAASAIPADGSDGDRKNGNFRSHAKQTRLSFTSWTPTEVGEAKLYLEGDFFGQGGDPGQGHGIGLGNADAVDLGRCCQVGSNGHLSVVSFRSAACRENSLPLGLDGPFSRVCEAAR